MKPFQKRKQGSCRFSAYYKLEWFDPQIYTWRPLQKMFETRELAEAAKSDGKVWRTFEVSESGRRLLP
jgi:hypothetical protein